MLQVVPFGSHVNGLQMHFSDIDMVVTGVLEPDDEKGGKQVVLSPSCLLVASAHVAAHSAFDTLPACTAFQANGVWHQHSPSPQLPLKGCQPDHVSTEYAQGVGLLHYVLQRAWLLLQGSARVPAAGWQLTCAESGPRCSARGALRPAWMASTSFHTLACRS